MRLIGTGMRAFPGKNDQRRIMLRNTGLTSAKLEVIASVGYPATQVVDPVTVAKALSAEIQAQTRYEAVPVVTNPIIYIHPHIGKDVIVDINVQTCGGAGAPDISVVTVGGITATLLGKTYLNVASGGCTGWYIAKDLAEGNVQVSITTAPAVPNGYCYSQAFSFLAGIRTGNITLQQSVLANPPAFNVIAQEDGSVVLCSGGDYGIGAILSETSGAPGFDPVHGMMNNSWVGMWRREGKGTMTFDFLMGAVPTCFTAGALEILPIG
jgi:hypothetical protein